MSPSSNSNITDPYQQFVELQNPDQQIHFLTTLSQQNGPSNNTLKLLLKVISNSTNRRVLTFVLFNLLRQYKHAIPIEPLAPLITHRYYATYAVELLAQVQPRDKTKALELCLSIIKANKSSKMLKAALVGLRGCDEQHAKDTFLNILESHGENEVRVVALCSLDYVCSSTEIEAISKQYINDKSRLIHDTCQWNLAQINDPKSNFPDQFREYYNSSPRL